MDGTNQFHSEVTNSKHVDIYYAFGRDIENVLLTNVEKP